MRNKRLSASFFIVLIIYALINLIMFLNVDALRTDSAVFWIAWATAFPLQLLILAYLGFAVKWKNAIVQKPVLYPIILSGALLYLVLGFIFMFAPIESIMAIVIAEASLTAIYSIVLFCAKRGADYIVSSQAYTKRKVGFLRFLKADVDDIILFTKDPSLLSVLTALSDDIRYSDPMSSPALASYETAIADNVMKASTCIRSANTTGAIQYVNEAKRLLEARNQRCKLLK